MTSQTMNLLAKLTDWKDFERLCADLLEAEQFSIDSEPSLDRTGTDIQVTEHLISHDPTRSFQLRWRVQCKHFAPSGKNLTRPDVEACLNSYRATRDHGEGLLLMVSTDYTEPAKETIDKFLAVHRECRVEAWNGRRILAKLDRYPQILRRYGLTPTPSHYLSAFDSLADCATGDVLFISDQSLMAHNLVAALGRVGGFNVICLPVWNYHDPVRLDILMSPVELASLRLVVCFLGDSFGLPMPPRLTQFISSCSAPLLLFPFVAWSRRRGLYGNLDGVCPVTLLDPTDAAESFDAYQIIGEFRRGDFRCLLAFDSFAEDQYVEYDPESADERVGNGIASRFGLSHSFEYLRPGPQAKVLWSDTAGNPFLIASARRDRRVCYVNSCCHGCLSSTPVASPLETSESFARALSNVCEWLLGCDAKGGT